MSLARIQRWIAPFGDERITYEAARPPINALKASLSLCLLLYCSEKASLAVTLVNANNDVMGHAAFFDYPNLPSVDPGKWEEWFHSKYDSKKCNVSIPNLLLVNNNPRK